MASVPSCNRLLQKKWEERKLKEHKERLRKIKSSIDNGYPKEFVHIRENKRKQRIEEDRQATIQRHNNQLLSKMHQIMHTTGRVDHRNTDWRPKKSLNHIKRQREIDKISRENLGLLRRLQTVQPQYSTKRWETDYREHHARAKSLQLFPSLQESRSRVVSERSGVSAVPILPPIITRGSSDRPETQPMSEIKEEIDVDD